MGPAAVLVAAMVAYGATIVSPARYLLGLVALCWALTVASALLRSPRVLQATLLMSLLASWTATMGLPMWPLPLLAPLVVFLAALVPSRRRRAELDWARWGVGSARLGAMSLGVVCVASTALVVWARAARPDLSGFVAQIPPVGGASLAALALAFALGNALLEEVIWRGVLLSALDEAFASGPAALALQALSFGCAHYYGFPSGAWGVAMATVYGLMLGAIRRSARGMLAPVLVHALADATIFAIVLRLTR